MTNGLEIYRTENRLGPKERFILTPSPVFLARSQHGKIDLGYQKEVIVSNRSVIGYGEEGMPLEYIGQLYDLHGNCIQFKKHHQNQNTDGVFLIVPVDLRAYCRPLLRQEQLLLTISCLKRFGLLDPNDRKAFYDPFLNRRLIGMLERQGDGFASLNHLRNIFFGENPWTETPALRKAA